MIETRLDGVPTLTVLRVAIDYDTIDTLFVQIGRWHTAPRLISRRIKLSTYTIQASASGTSHVKVGKSVVDRNVFEMWLAYDKDNWLACSSLDLIPLHHCRPQKLDASWHDVSWLLAATLRQDACALVRRGQQRDSFALLKLETVLHQNDFRGP
jgi:hypothetical protein